MNQTYGPEVWCSVLSADDPETDRIIAEYYPGRKIVVSL